MTTAEKTFREFAHETEALAYRMKQAHLKDEAEAVQLVADKLKFENREMNAMPVRCPLLAAVAGK